MAYRSFVSLNIAIIGNNKLSEVVAAAYIDAGHTIYMACPSGDTPATTSLIGHIEGVHYCSIEEAAAFADFIVISTRANDVREVAYWLGDVRKKVIIDLTANVPEGLKDNVNTLAAIKAITGSEHIVKVLSLYNHEQVFAPLFGGKKVQVVLAGDSRKAKEIMKIICIELGVDLFHDFGGTENIALFDELCKCCRSMIKINYQKLNIIKASK